MQKQRGSIDEQTIHDLEFSTIREWLTQYALGTTAKNRLEKLVPSTHKEEIEEELNKVFEYLSIREQGENLPALDFEELTAELKTLPIRNAVLTAEGFIRIHQASSLVNRLLYFMDKREKDYPHLFALFNEVEYTKEIVEHIEKIFDRKGEIKDDASEKLMEIRGNLRSTKDRINKNFEREIRKLSKENVLGDTKEAFVNERRVLTILSSHKRKIEGNVVGSSKSGSLTFVEPAVNVELNREYDILLDEERREIREILKKLTAIISSYLPLIAAYQVLLTEMDFVHAKMKLAQQLQASKPNINEDNTLELIDAYHPILWKNNQELKKPTFPQRIKMDTFSRMLVISGPNAGGKSITLKTVGLLQLMLQAGLLVPVHPNSKFFIFQKILSDIGDNQSIANELSTYSYRLKRMKHFLEITNRRTLLLLDEFGTGSDPDLGGALAEIFFEELYNRKAFGVITTHYANIKLKADQLRNAVNGCMLFDTETLAPLFKFNTGQPGSSFTFEVAQINGIPQEIIDKAKGRINNEKLQMDQLLLELQREKTYLEKLNQEHIEAQETAQKAYRDYTQKKTQLESKSASLQNTIDQNNRFVVLGKKMAGFVDRFTIKSRNKGANTEVLNDLTKFLKIEKTKLEEIKLQKQVVKAVKKKAAKAKPEVDQHQRHKIKEGSQVKLISTKKSGTVESVDGDQITVLFGFMKMKVDRSKLTWIQ